MQLLALSSGEAELCAVTKAAAEGLGLQAILADFAHLATVELHSDASVSPVPLVEFYEELDGLAWSLSLVAPDEEIRGGADRWALLEDGGWRRLDR